MNEIRHYALADNANMGICHYAFIHYICHYAFHRKGAHLVELPIAG